VAPIAQLIFIVVSFSVFFSAWLRSTPGARLSARAPVLRAHDWPVGLPHQIEDVTHDPTLAAAGNILDHLLDRPTSLAFVKAARILILHIRQEIHTALAARALPLGRRSDQALADALSVISGKHMQVVDKCAPFRLGLRLDAHETGRASIRLSQQHEAVFGGQIRKARMPVATPLLARLAIRKRIRKNTAIGVAPAFGVEDCDQAGIGKRCFSKCDLCHARMVARVQENRAAKRPVGGRRGHPPPAGRQTEKSA
jgi:hypothetical protein